MVPSRLFCGLLAALVVLAGCETGGEPFIKKPRAQQRQDPEQPVSPRQLEFAQDPNGTGGGGGPGSSHGGRGGVSDPRRSPSGRAYAFTRPDVISSPLRGEPPKPPGIYALQKNDHFLQQLQFSGKRLPDVLTEVLSHIPYTSRMQADEMTNIILSEQDASLAKSITHKQILALEHRMGITEGDGLSVVVPAPVKGQEATVFVVKEPLSREEEVAVEAGLPQNLWIGNAADSVKDTDPVNKKPLGHALMHASMYFNAVDLLIDQKKANAPFNPADANTLKVGFRHLVGAMAFTLKAVQTIPNYLRTPEGSTLHKAVEALYQRGLQLAEQARVSGVPFDAQTQTYIDNLRAPTSPLAPLIRTFGVASPTAVASAR